MERAAAWPNIELTFRTDEIDVVVTGLHQHQSNLFAERDQPCPEQSA